MTIVRNSVRIHDEYVRWVKNRISIYQRTAQRRSSQVRGFCGKGIEPAWELSYENAA